MYTCGVPVPISVSNTVNRLRAAMLARLNGAIARREIAALPSSRMPSYIVVTPELTHLAPLAAGNSGERVQPVFVANGIGERDVEWLARRCPDTPIIPLRASLRKSGESLLDHGVVIERLAAATRHPIFCVQDADCFVTEPGFWRSVTLDPEKEFAAGPFVRKAANEKPEFPETFLVCLNQALMGSLRRSDGITAEATLRPSRRARELLAQAGFGEGTYMESRKAYFDTLQQYWIAAKLCGFEFRRISGEGESVHHIGGTSYLHRTFEDLAHWDFWPLNVHYFHLRLLELPACAGFRDRFRRLIDFHGTADALLSAYPDYAHGWRRAAADSVIAATRAEEVYSHD